MRPLLQLAMIVISMMHENLSAQTDQQDCGNTSFSGPNGVITSPNVSLPHPLNLRCTYSIDVGRNNSVILKFVSFELAPPYYVDNRCTYQWLMLTCNETTADRELNFTRKYCGRTFAITSIRFFDCPAMELNFFSREFINHGGFIIEYTVVENSNASNISDEVCGNTSFTGPTGIITSPRFPLSYPHNLDCVYSINADRTKTVLLNFLSFQLGRLVQHHRFDDCDNEWLTVSCLSNDSLSKNHYENRKICGTKTSRMTLWYSSCDSVTINFVTDSTITEGGFKLRYTISSPGDSTQAIPDEVCGYTSFTGPSGVITSPRFPLFYLHEIECVYTIAVDRMKTVLLRFLSFNIRGSWLEEDNECDYDGLTISCLLYNSGSKNPEREREYCGENTPLPVIRYSSCKSLKLRFVSSPDYSDPETGFKLRYEIISLENSTRAGPDDDCGYTFFTGPTEVISSPKFPLSYPHNLNCLYHISVDRTKSVLIYSLSFDLEGSSLHPNPDDCDFDWLTINCLSNGSAPQNSSQNRRYCGEKQTPLVLRYSRCDFLTVYFATDDSDAKGGFQLRYIITPLDQSDCGNTLFSGPNGVITSPNVPLPYPLNLSCDYSIDAGRNKSVLLRFTYFDLEKPNATGYCVRDWLMITCNGTTQTTPNNKEKYCGTIQWRSLRFLNCSSLVLKFSGSSSITNSTGFIIDYTVAENSISELDCGNTLFTNSSGVISLPSNPTNYLAIVNCAYIISTNQTSTIMLYNILWHSKQLLQLLQSFQNCSRENITIGCLSEGETRLNPNTTKVLCNREIASSDLSQSQLLFADCRTLKLSIHSTTYDNRETFHIPYLALRTNEECGNTLFAATSGIISSWKVPWPYLRPVNCLYVISGGRVKSVVLSLDYVDLDYIYTRNTDCGSKWLTITCLLNGTSVAHPFADRKQCAPVHQQLVIRFPGCHAVLLNYSKGGSIQDTSFAVRYRMGDYDEECGESSLYGPTGVLTSPRFPLSYPHKLNCMYSIVGIGRNVISLSFSKFQLKGISNPNSTDYCSSEWLTVICLSDESAAEQLSSSRKYCGRMSTPLKFTFSDCASVVLNFVTDSSVAHGRFILRYVVTDKNSLCGVRFHDGPSGAIYFPWNYGSIRYSYDCNYVINATESSSISLTIWTISFLSLAGENCQRDWLQITCVDGQTELNQSVSHASCDHLTSSTQLTFSSCEAVEIVFHKDAIATGKTFHIEYTVTGYGDFDVHNQTNLIGKYGHSIVISVTVVLVVVAAIGLAALLLCRRHRRKNRSQMLMQASEVETAQLGLENDNADAAQCSCDQNSSKYVPLRPLSHHDEDSSPSNSSKQFNEDMQPVLSDESCLSSQKP